MSARGFAFNAKYGLLTYAQCGDLDPWAVNNHLGDLGAECIIGREDHVDGGVHLHAFFMFERVFRTRDVRKFDVGGCHPNIRKGYGTPHKGYDYATKEGDVVAGGLARPSGERLDPPLSKWHDVLLATSREEFFEIIEQVDPRALLLSFPSLCKFADYRFRLERTPYVHPPGITFVEGAIPRAVEWARENLGGHTVVGE